MAEPVQRAGHKVRAVWKFAEGKHVGSEKISLSEVETGVMDMFLLFSAWLRGLWQAAPEATAGPALCSDSDMCLSVSGWHSGRACPGTACSACQGVTSARSVGVHIGQNKPEEEK